MISSVTDDKGRRTVVDLLPNVKRAHLPQWDAWTGIHLGLDFDQRGDFYRWMIHPRNEIDKVYVARVKRLPTKKISVP